LPKKLEWEGEVGGNRRGEGGFRRGEGGRRV